MNIDEKINSLNYISEDSLKSFIDLSISISNFINSLDGFGIEDFKPSLLFASKCDSFREGPIKLIKLISDKSEIPSEYIKKYNCIIGLMNDNKKESNQLKLLDDIYRMEKRIENAFLLSDVESIEKDFNELYNLLDSEHQKDNKVQTLKEMIHEKKVKCEKAFNKYINVRFFVVLTFFLLLFAVLMFGITMWNRYPAKDAISFMIGKLPYFGYTWHNWAKGLWDVWNSMGSNNPVDFLLKAGAAVIFAIIYIFPLIVEVLVIVLSNIVFALCWLICTIIGFILLGLFYALQGALGIFTIIVLYVTARDEPGRKSFIYSLTTIYILLVVTATVFAYFIGFGFIL